MRPPLTPPNLHSDLPLYPAPLQALRVTGGTVPGPSGYASSSVLGASLYIAFVQQLHPETLLPRDREPCFALDLNRYGLSPGYYTNCRLAGSYQSLPVYEVGGAPVSPVAAFSQGPLGAGGLTSAQIIQLSTLAPSQVAVLNNLNPCQLQTLLTALPISQIHTLTLTLTPTQLTNLINVLTPTELTNLYTALTTSQVITLTSTLNQQQTQTLAQTLTPAQIRTLISNLTSTQLQTLAGMTPQQIETLVTNLTTAQLVVFLSVSPLSGTIHGTVSTQTGTSYTFGAADLGRLVTFANAAAMAGTLPAASSLGPGWNATVWNAGPGTLTLTPASGTINSAASFTVAASTGTQVWSDGANYRIASGGAGVSSGAVTGSGTVNALPKVTAASPYTLGDSTITDDGTTTRPTKRLALGPASTTLTLVANTNDLDIGDRVIVELAAGADYNLTGFTSGSVPGRVAILWNTGTSTITLKHNSASSTDANRMDLPNQQDLALGPRMGAIFLWPTIADTHWRCAGTTAFPADGSVTNARLADMAQATIKGRASGAGTGDPSDLTISQALDMLGSTANGDLPFRTGGSWSRLAVGADADKLLGVSSSLPAYVVHRGKALDASYVATHESTTSTSPVALTTADSITFTLAAAAEVRISFSCNTWNSTAGQHTRVNLYDMTGGGAGTNTSAFCDVASTNASDAAACAIGYAVSLAAGTYTYAMRYSAVSSGTANFRVRELYAEIVG